MVKQRKTLEQKKIADLRHKLYSFNPAQRGSDSKNIPSLRTNTLSQARNTENISTTISLTNKYPYLTSDILKTGILTGLILLAQVLLFILLNNKIIVLPIVSY